jgi:hypothetical protein
MQLSSLGRLTHERHFNTRKFKRDEMYIPGRGGGRRKDGRARGERVARSLRVARKGDTWQGR